MSGLHTLASRRAAVVSASTAGDSNTVGWLVDDYNWGESQVLQLVQYFDSLQRPPEFEARIQALYKAYEDAKSFWAIRSLINASAMKDLGVQAQTLMRELEAFVQKKARAAGLPVPQGVSTSLTPPPPPESLLMPSVPWWLWLIGGVAVVGVVGYFAAPIIVSAVSARKMLAR